MESSFRLLVSSFPVFKRIVQVKVRLQTHSSFYKGAFDCVRQTVELLLYSDRSTSLSTVV